MPVYVTLPPMGETDEVDVVFKAAAQRVAGTEKYMGSIVTEMGFVRPEQQLHAHSPMSMHLSDMTMPEPQTIFAVKDNCLTEAEIKSLKAGGAEVSQTQPQGYRHLKTMSPA